jgi:group I intron endonuclease
MLTNRVNKKIYIGKATNLKQRLRSYIDVKSLTKTAPSSMIARSILKFGLENFSYTIIENCEKELLNKRERFYISSFKPQYNIRKPGPCDISYPL